MLDVRRGVAVREQDHVLGREGHHQLTHAVIYKYGPEKGQVFARGSMRHTRGEHRMLALRMLALPTWFASSAVFKACPWSVANFSTELELRHPSHLTA
jgi:hypothetical protein